MKTSHLDEENLLNDIDYKKWKKMYVYMHMGNFYSNCPLPTNPKKQIFSSFSKSLIDHIQPNFQQSREL